MKSFNSHRTLSGISPFELGRVIEQLNRTGFVTDEDGLCLGAALIEYWSGECTALIRGCGYDGGELMVRGQFFNEVGAIYVLYDATRHAGEEAAEELQRVAERERLAQSFPGL